MRTQLFFAAALVACCVTSSTEASLRTVAVGDTLNFNTSLGYRTGSGGEFAVSRNAPISTPNYFHTFCAEIGEYIYNGENVTVSALSTTSSSSIPVNTLSFGAAKLFSDYYNGIAASNYGFGIGTDFVLPGGATGSNPVTFSLSDAAGNRAADGSAVQIALWHLIGETQAPALSGASLDLFNFYNVDANVVDDPNYFGVRIANLTGATLQQNVTGEWTYNRQDQFVMVPEMSTIAVWSVLSLLGAGVAYRRNAKQLS
jgi:hypothetical protein